MLDIGDERAERTPWRGAVAIALATVVAYAPAFACGWVWDDDDNITANPSTRTFARLVRTWTDVHANQQYYPLTHTSFWVQWQLHGDQPFAYHALNIVLHALGAIALYRALAALKVRGALLAALLFAVHPVHVESVAWITERKNVLSGVFAALTVLFYARALEADDRGAPRGVELARALACLVLGLLSKTAIAPLPAALVCLAVARRGAVRMRDLIPLAPFFVIAIAAGLGTAWLEHSHVFAQGPEFDWPFAERVLVAGRAFWFYPSSVVWPFDINFVYPKWVMNSSSLAQWMYPLSAVVVLAGLLAARRQIGLWPLAGALCYALLIFPALGFFNVYYMRYSYVQDHFQYHASAAVFALIGAGMARVGDRLAPRARVLAAAAVLSGLGVLTALGCGRFRDYETLFRDSLARNPGAWIAQLNLGLRLQRAGRLAEAESLYRQGIATYPRDPQLHSNLGAALADQGRLDAAIVEFVNANALAPTNPDTQLNLGLALERAGRPREAAPAYARALELRPTWTKAQRLFAWLLATSPDAAVRDGARAVTLAEAACARTTKARARCLDTLAAAYAEAGRFEDAARTEEEAQRLAAGTSAADAYTARGALYSSGKAYHAAPVGAEKMGEGE